MYSMPWYVFRMVCCMYVQYDVQVHTYCGPKDSVRVARRAPLMVIAEQRSVGWHVRVTFGRIALLL